MPDNSKYKILITCPPMLGMINKFKPIFVKNNSELTLPEVSQTLTENQLIDILPEHDGWIIGDDPATRRVLEAGRKGRLKAAIKWGVGVDNIDHEAARALGIRFSNTPFMFGNEVADLAISYVLALARETFLIDKSVKSGGWDKRLGISLQNKQAAVLGYGDIGKNLSQKLKIFGLHVTVYDPAYSGLDSSSGIEFRSFPENIENADFLILTCALNKENYHIINKDIFKLLKKGARIVNVARGPLIDEQALVNALKSGKIHSVALDVFETEPLPLNSELRNFERNIFGSHNGSNTNDAVERASLKSIELLFNYLNSEQDTSLLFKQ